MAGTWCVDERFGLLDRGGRSEPGMMSIGDADPAHRAKAQMVSL